MEYLGVSTNFLMKQWKQTKDNITNFQRKKAEEFRCDIECRALEMHDSKCTRVKTPLLSLNNMTNGGFQSATVTEIVGPPGSGKSQFCLSLIANYLSSERDKKVIYIDTNKNFSFTRLFQLWDLKTEDYLNENIVDRLNHLFIFEPLSKDEFIEIFDHIDSCVQSLQPSIIIIDSMAYYIRGITDMIERLNISCKIIAVVKKLAVKYNVMVIITNQITGFSFNGNQSAALGSSWLHFINLRIYFDFQCIDEKCSEESMVRKASVVKSPLMVNFDLQFRITSQGLQEA